MTRKPQIGENDRFMDGSQALNRLELYNNSAADQKVHSVATLEFHIFVNDRHWLLSLHCYPAQSEFLRKAFLVRRFEQPWTEKAMNLNRCTDYFMRDFVIGHAEGNSTQSAQRTATKSTEKSYVMATSS
jgi:hypothetical protein